MPSKQSAIDMAHASEGERRNSGSGERASGERTASSRSSERTDRRASGELAPHEQQASSEHFSECASRQAWSGTIMRSGLNVLSASTNRCC